MDGRLDTAHDEAELQLAKSLVRLQLVTPLSLLVFIVSVLIAALVAHPSIKEINEWWLTILTPNSNVVGVYWLVIVVLQVGMCLLLAVARKEETRRLVVHGVGSRMAIVNVLMAVWVLFWTLRLFLLAEITLFVVAFIAFSIWGTLLRHPPIRSRPLDYLFVHAPARLILVLLFTVDIWQSGLLALHWYRYIGPDPSLDNGHGKWENDHGVHSWGAFGLILGLALVNSLIVFTWTDVAWAVGAIWSNVAMASRSRGKAPQVFITLVLSSALVFIALVSSIGWNMIKADRAGAIRLEEEAAEEDGVVSPARPIGA